MAIVFKGKAQISGVNGTVNVDGVGWALLKESMRISRVHDEDIIKDENGQDAAWSARNQKDEGDIGFRLVDTGSPTTEANIEQFCSALMDNPYAVITLSNCTPEIFEGDYQAISGQELNLSNTTAGGGSLKLRKYVDEDQRNLSVATFTPTYV